MSQKKPQEAFDHGRFWDSYSSTWDRKGDGQYVPVPGKDVLGAEWGDDQEASDIIQRWIVPHVPAGARILEIGPGGGKFSRILDRLASELVLVDVSQAMLDRAVTACRRKPAAHLLDGETLRPLADQGFDLVFSYDVFIHLESEEIFRYLAEVNRVLKPGGLFLVHTSTFESRFGMLSFFRQIRDHRPLIGSRYGGRMYPMSLGTMRRLAWNSGFDVVAEHGDWGDRNIVFLLRRTQPPWLWRFAATPELFQHWEICERIGGSTRRAFHAAMARGDGSLAVVLLGDASDPYLRAAAAAKVPAHPCLLAPLGFESHAGSGLVRYPYRRGPAFSRLLAGERIEMGTRKEPWRLVAGLLEAVKIAHDAGLVHGELHPDFMVLDVEAGQLGIPGFVAPASAGAGDAAAAAAADRAEVVRLLDAVAIPESIAGTLREAGAAFAAGTLEIPAMHHLARRILETIDP